MLTLLPALRIAALLPSCPMTSPAPLSNLPTPPGERIQKEFGLPNLVRFPIVPDLSAAGDTGKPVVVEVSAGRCKLIGSWDDCL